MPVIPRLLRFMRMFGQSVRRYGLVWSLPRFWVLKQAYFDRRPAVAGMRFAYVTVTDMKTG